MNRTNVKNALLGVVIALVAAYLFPAFLATLLVGPEGLRLLFSAETFSALFYTSWMVIPLGGALGMLIPRIAAGKSRWVAAAHGAGYGAAGGAALMLCFVSVFNPLFGSSLILLAVMAYCAVWVGAYGYVRATAPVPHR